jgi:MFS transporter, PPP family, 3-phenylpropionic acid transporter
MKVPMVRASSALWLFLSAYALLYGAFGVQSPFVPALLGERGLSAEDIGLVLAAAMIVRVLVGPLVSHAADRLRRHAAILSGCALFAALATVSFLLARNFAGLLCVALLHAATLGPIAPITDALASRAAHESRADCARTFEYGWVRAAGSMAFALGTLAGGWQARASGLAAAMWISGGLLVLGGAVVPSLPKLAVAESSARLRATMLRDGLFLLRIPAYRRLLIAASLLWGSHAMHDSFSVIRWRGAGIDFFTISALWSESVFAEVVVFLLIGPWLVRRIGSNWSMMLATGAGVIRWGIAAFTTSPGVLACIQPLHGLTFALFHLAAIQLIVAVTPVRIAATAQAIYGTLSVGLVIALLTGASGLLYARVGGLAFLFMAALCLLALPVCAGLRAPSEEPGALRAQDTTISMHRGEPR